jgi:outer membrane protein assembly factor BamB
MRGVIFLVCLTSTTGATDWPRWRGLTFDGVSAEKGWLDRWPKDSPPVAWRASVGTGFSSVAVAGGRLYTMGHADDKETVWCLDAANGKVIWSHSYDAALGNVMFEGGPTSTPTVHDGRVYTLGHWGDLVCLDAATGKTRWSMNLDRDAGLPVPGWGFSGSPLVHDRLVVLNAGGAGLAVDRDTGKVTWASDREEAGYSSPVPFRAGADTLVLVSSGNAYSVVDVKTGKVRWRVRWVTRYGLNAADPVVADGHVFLSSGYNKGGALLKLGDEALTEMWRNKNMRNQLNPSVLLGGHLYGVDGDTTSGAVLRCVEWKTGALRWTFEGAGSGSLTAADGKLIVLSDRGELLVGPASPKGFEPTARAKVLDGKCWTVPVLSGGRIYCRNAAGDLVCVDVRSR